MLIETIIRGAEEDLAVVLVQDEQDLAQVFKFTLLFCFGLKRVSNVIQFLDVLFVIQDFIFLLFLLLLLSFSVWFFSRASPTMLSQPLLLEVGKLSLEVLWLLLERPMDWKISYVAHK